MRKYKDRSLSGLQKAYLTTSQGHLGGKLALPAQFLLPYIEHCTFLSSASLCSDPQEVSRIIVTHVGGSLVLT